MGAPLFGTTILCSLFWLVMGFALGGSFVSQLGVPMNFNLTPASFAWAVSIISLAFFGLLVVLIWCGCFRRKVSLNCFRDSRMVLAFLAVAYAGWFVFRLIPNVPLPKHLDPEFLRELIAYSIFWVLVPPIWFFVEYFAVESKWIDGLPDNIEPNLKTIKDYADYASKIWAGVLALLLALIAFKQE
jgi:hypothetical protein